MNGWLTGTWGMWIQLAAYYLGTCIGHWLYKTLHPE